MRVCAFDPGFSFGYGYLGGGLPPLSGSHSLPGSSRELGFALSSAETWLGKILRHERPDAVVYAIPFIGKKVTPESLKPLMCFSGMIEKVAFDLEIPCYELDESAARRHLLVHVPRRSKAIKIAVINACRARGWPVPDNHAGDALCVAALALELLKPEAAHQTTPLFQGARS